MNPLLAVLGAIAFVLVLVIAAEAYFGSSPASALAASEHKRASAADAKLLPLIAAISPDQAYPESAGRPLFVPTRRPAPEAPATGQGALQKGQFVLQGVIVVGDNRVAMLKEKASGKIHRAETGKEVNGIKVLEIEKESVTLGLGTDQEKLALDVIKPTGAPPPAVAAGPFATAPAAVPPGAASPPGVPAPGQPPGAGAPPAPGGIQGAPGAGAGPRPAAEANPAQPNPEDALARRRASRRSTPQATQQTN
jgi:hypothetical protein